MSNNLTFNEALEFCTGAQENKDVAECRVDFSLPLFLYNF